MPLLHIIVIAAIQGITEFLPISSSAHLALLPTVTGWSDQGLLIDIAVHVGTLGAVIVYLWSDIWDMIVGLVRFTKGRPSPGIRMLGYLILATIPVLIVGYFVKIHFGASLRSVEVIGWAMLGFGVLLYMFDRIGLTVRRLEHMTTTSALVIGVAQVLALIPGASRAGVTITAARLVGFERRESARFSMLMSIPTILGAGALAGLDLAKAGNAELRGDAILAGGFAFFAALAAISLMMGWLRRASFAPFVLYRVALGAAILGWLYYA